MTTVKFFDINRLKLFHRERDRVPDPTPEIEERVAELDPDLKPDELAYVNHYLGYADILLREHPRETITATPEFPDNIVEMPRRQPDDSQDFSEQREKKYRAA